MEQKLMPPKNPVLSFRLKDPGGVLAYDGALAKGLELLFGRLPDALARRKTIDALEKAHAKLLADESGPDVDQATAAQVASLASQVHPDSALPSLTPEGHAARLATVPNLSAAYDGFRVFPPCATGCSNPACPEYGAAWPAEGRHCPTCSGADKV
jgi:hypothetical protein